MKGHLILGAVIILIIAVYLLLSDDVDKCLDAGGRWNYELKRCEFQRGQ